MPFHCFIVGFVIHWVHRGNKFNITNWCSLEYHIYISIMSFFKLRLIQGIINTPGFNWNNLRFIWLKNVGFHLKDGQNYQLKLFKFVISREH